MGRGRQKAKHTKIARELKYDTYTVKYSALEKELGHHDEDPYVDAALGGDGADFLLGNEGDDWLEAGGVEQQASLALALARRAKVRVGDLDESQVWLHGSSSRHEAYSAVAGGL